MSNKPKYKTFAAAKYKLYKPDADTIKKTESALTTDAFKDIGRQILPQEDLLYIKSVLVTTGYNENDDVFFEDEMWKARSSPILKPMDWMHKESDIIGVMFNVQARDLEECESLDFSLSSYNKPFELVTESVVYKLLFPDKAKEIKDKSESNEMFVSMECWFNDYDYVIYSEDGVLQDVVKRNPDTAFLDGCLKAYGGTGAFQDPTDGTIKLVKRGLRDIIFGGCGFVYRPANLRSVIEGVTDQNPYELPSDETGEDMDVKIINLIDTLQGIVKNDKICANKEVDKMSESTDNKDLKSDIAEVLDEREAKAKADNELKELQEKAALVAGLQEQLNDLKGKVNTVNDSKTALLSSYTDTMKEIVKVVANAPVDIKVLDEVDDVEKVFADQLNWLRETISTLVDATKENKTMANKLRDMALKEREDQIKLLMSDFMGEDVIESMVDTAKAMDDETYEKWLEEKKTFAAIINKSKENKVDASETNDTSEVLNDVDVEVTPNLSGAANEVDQSVEDKGMDEAVAGMFDCDDGDNDS